MQNKLIFIGGGNMAEAIFSKLDASDFEIIITQRNSIKRKYLQTKYPQFIVTDDLKENAIQNDIIILAIKPQDAKETCKSLKDKIKNATIISVMAGLTVATLQGWLSTDKLVRAMPNTPSALGLGITGLYRSPSVDLKTYQIIEDLFKTIGLVYDFADEDGIDKITPVASSAVAYNFYFIECLIAVAVQNFGFDHKAAKEIALQVIRGSLNMIEGNPNLSIEQLRAQVTSKKGATEQAILIFEKYNFKQIIKEAEIACYNRAKEMAKLFA